MRYSQYVSLCLVTLVLGQVAALPQHHQYPQQLQQRLREDRKFAAKPNAVKKVAIEELEDDGTDRIEEASNIGFSWLNILGIMKQILLGKGAASSASKNEIDAEASSSPWKSVVTIAFKIAAALIGGPQTNIEGLDKENNENGPLQFSTLVVNLLEMLRSSFSHRSLVARSMGRRDTISEAAAASIVMMKGYVKTLKPFDNIGSEEEEGQRGCAERALCEASAECTADAQGTSSIFCQLGSYATSYLLQRQSGVGFEALYEAGRRGRTGGDCRTLFVDCNAV